MKFTLFILFFLINSLINVTPDAKAAPGDIDTSFGTDGLVTLDVLSNDHINVIAPLSEGGFFAAGSSAGSMIVLKYDSNGVLVPSFGDEGKLILDLFSGWEDISGAAITSDGKLLVSGSRSPNNSFLLRLDSTTGDLDTSFHGDGIAEAPSPDVRFGELGLLTDSRIAVAGSFGIYMYTPDGSLDDSFAEDGLTDIMEGSSGSGCRSKIVLQSDNKPVCLSGGGGGLHDVGLMRADLVGNADSTFSGDGIATADFDESFFYGDLAITADDAFLIHLSRDINADTDRNYLFKFTNSGSLDGNFDGDGILTWDASTGIGMGVVTQPNGKVLALSRPAYNRPALKRFDSTTGAIDTSFGTGGEASFLMTSWAGFQTLALQPDGKILAAGYYVRGYEDDIFIVRFEGDPPACGDRVVQSSRGEECDDGNITSGDGCSARCIREYCGDRIVQRLIGEVCDDGNTVDGDGCSSICAREAPPPRYEGPTLSISNTTVDEGSGPAMVTVTMTGTSADTVTVDYRTTDESARGVDDYRSMMGTLTWASGETGAKTISVPIVNDRIVERSEVFHVLIDRAVNAMIVGGGDGLVRIADNDPERGTGGSPRRRRTEGR